jgi:hypothetical protein
MKVLRLSALVAAGVNYSFPLIEASHVMWAINLVQNDIRNLSAKFDKGEIGLHSHENKQISHTLACINDYIKSDWEKTKKYTKNESMFRDRIIPYEYLQRRLISQMPFKVDRAGATNALKRTVQTLIDTDRIREIGRVELLSKYATTGRAFVISDKNVIV